MSIAMSESMMVLHWSYSTCDHPHTCGKSSNPYHIKSLYISLYVLVRKYLLKTLVMILRNLMLKIKSRCISEQTPEIVIINCQAYGSVSANARHNEGVYKAILKLNVIMYIIFNNFKLLETSIAFYYATIFFRFCTELQEKYRPCLTLTIS